MHDFSYIDYINQAPGLSLAKDRASNIVACSPRLASLLGFNSPDEIAGLSDFELRCDAAKGAEQFIEQDQKALTYGSHKAIDIYQYADGFLTMIYQEKKALKLNGKTIGLSLYGYELPKVHQFSQQIMSLVGDEATLKHLKPSESRSYVFHETYPNSTLTKKESLCLYYIIRGKNNREISERLNLSSRTVEGKIVEIKAKLSCDSRNQLIEKAINDGYLYVIIEQLFKDKAFSISLN